MASLSLHGQRVDIVGVHLKAGAHSANLRLAQIKELVQSEHLASQVIVIGDFNTFPNTDEALAQQLQLAQYQELTNSLPTYLGKNERTFDRAWVKALAGGELQVYGPCRRDSVARPYAEYDFYQRFISDHCAIQVRIDLKDKP